MARTSGQRGADQVWPPHDQGIARLAVVTNGGGAENGRALRTLALVAVVVGLVALTTAACVLSYSSVHDFALRAGVSPSLARIYPDICDAMLVMAGCSVLALRGAGVLAKLYGWLCFILLLGTVAASSVVHEADITMSKRATEIIAAVFPWALVLVAFGLLLALLRHARRRRQSQRANSAAEGGGLGGARAEFEPPALEAGEAYGDPVSYEDAGAYGREPEPFEYVTSQEPSATYPTTPLEADESHGHDTPAAQSPRTALRPTEMQLRARNPRQLPPPNPPPTEAGGSTTEADPPTTKAVTATGGSATEADGPTTKTVTEAGEPITEAGGPTTKAVTEAGGSTTEAGKPLAEADRSATEAGGPVGGQPTSGYTGDTIPRGEMNAAPTIDQPAEPTPSAQHGQHSPETSSNRSGQPPELDRPRSSPTPPSD